MKPFRIWWAPWALALGEGTTREVQSPILQGNEDEAARFGGGLRLRAEIAFFASAPIATRSTRLSGVYRALRSVRSEGVAMSLSGESDCTRRPQAGLCRLTAAEVVLGGPSGLDIKSRKCTSLRRRGRRERRRIGVDWRRRAKDLRRARHAVPLRKEGKIQTPTLCFAKDGAPEKPKGGRR